MSSVSKCDCCGKVGKHEEYNYIKLFGENKTGSVGKLELTVEICPECANKVLEVIKGAITENGSK